MGDAIYIVGKLISWTVAVVGLYLVARYIGKLRLRPALAISIIGTAVLFIFNYTSDQLIRFAKALFSK